MPDPYPLEALLNVRLYREDAANRSVAIAKRELKEALETAQAVREALSAWRIWRDAETERRYEALLGRRVVIEKLQAFNQGLANLSLQELEKTAAVEAADKKALECRKKMETAAQAARAARQNTAKIELHKSIWAEESKKEAERAEDLELEEFHPVLQQADEDS